jgi:ribose transport system substrate-binding protein
VSAPASFRPVTLAAALLATALGLGLPGCGRKDEPAPARRPRIALVMKSLANEFFLTMEKGARDHQRQHAAEYVLLANGIKDELDVARQVDLVEQMIADKVSAIVLAPADSKALVPAAKRAADAGIVVVNIDNRLDPALLAERGLRAPFVGPDNRKGARLAGEYLARRLRPGDEVAIVEGLPTAENAVQRRLGFEDAVKAAGLKIVSSQPGDWEMAKANQVVSAQLTEHPSLKAVLCANDSMALGAVAAIKEAGRTGRVLVVGFDNISAVQDLVREGRVLATVDQHADELAVFGIEYALDILGGRAMPADRETPVDLVTAGTLAAGR